MNEKITQREQEIVDLREREQMTFRAIGERYQISAGQAANIYHRAQRSRRLERARMMREEQNQKIVSLEISVGEIVMLRRILYLFQHWKMKDSWSRKSEWEQVREDPDFVTAGELINRICKLEREARKNRK